jgi:uncharacterized membrane protein YczE
VVNEFVDKIFKIGLLVLGVGYLVYLFCPVSNQAGRYSIQEMGDRMSIIDTTNANVYVTKNLLDWTMINPITSKANNIEILPKPKKAKK